MSDDISLAMEGALAVIAVVGVYCLVEPPRESWRLNFLRKR
ncbi:hypothetical protein ACVHTZ_005207 [Escherichia coli]